MGKHIYRLDGDRVALSILKPDDETRTSLLSCCYHGNPMDWYFMDIIRDEYDKLYVESS